MAGNVKTDLVNEQSTGAGVDIPDLKVTETGGPTKLKMGSVSDGDFLKRSGTNLVGAASPSGWVDDGAVVRLGTAVDDVGIGTATPDASAKLEIASTTKAFLPPRMTTTQIDAISSPATGSLVFDTTENLLRIRKSSAWCHIPCGIITGQFSDLTDQLPSVTTPVVITFNTNDITLKGLSHSTTVSPEEFTADIAKAFTFMMAPQWTSNKELVTLDFFVQLDTGSGFVNVANSNIKIVFAANGSNVSPLMVTINMSVNDKVRFMQRASTTIDGIGIKFTASDSEVPATPSVILTVFSGD